MFIKVKHVDVETVQGGKSSYEVAEVSYDTDRYKNQVFKVMSFLNPEVFATIKKATKGDTFNVEVTKNQKGYNQWVSIAAADSASADDSPSHAPSRPAAGSAAPSVNRSFETAEERADRQRLIVRQSSLTAALATLSPGSKGPLDPESVKALAENYTNWVFEKVDLFDQPNDLSE